MLNQPQPFGEHIQQKDKASARIDSIKAHGIFANKNDKIKEISASMVENNIYIFGIAEINTHWKMEIYLDLP